MHILHAARPLSWQRRPLTEAGIGWLALSTSMLAGATYNSFAKALSPALSPLSLVFVSELLVLLFVLVSFGAVPIARSCGNLSRSDVAWLFVIGTLNGLIGPGLWFTGLSMTTAVNAGFFGKIEMVFLLVCAGVFLKETITRTHVLAMCAILAGMTVISLKGFTEGLLRVQQGDLVIVAAALSFAMGSVLCRKFATHLKPHILLGARSVTAICAFLAASPFIHHGLSGEIRSFPIALVPALIGFAFISRFINSVSFYEALERLPVSTITLTGAIDVILGTVVAWAMLGEPIRWYHFLGGAFLVMGTLLLELIGTHPSKEALEHHVRQRHR